MIKRPMLAVTVEDFEKIQYPVLASPKLDGIRCLKVGGKALSRKFKPIPNHYVRNWIEKNVPDGVDGEIMLPNAVFREITSAIMSEEGEPFFYFAAFDYVQHSTHTPFRFRLEELTGVVRKVDSPHLIKVRHQVVQNYKDLRRVHEGHKADGYEGTMIRDPRGPYKQGRSTLREGYLLKVKDFADEEAVILDVVPLETNTNAAELNELGYTKRSSAKAGKVATDLAGSLLMRFKDGTEFGCGSGFTQEDRKFILSNKDKFIGRWAKVKYQPPRAEGEPPRFPVYLGLRDERDT